MQKKKTKQKQPNQENKKQKILSYSCDPIFSTERHIENKRNLILFLFIYLFIIVFPRRSQWFLNRPYKVIGWSVAAVRPVRATKTSGRLTTISLKAKTKMASNSLRQMRRKYSKPITSSLAITFSYLLFVKSSSLSRLTLPIGGKWM